MRYPGDFVLEVCREEVVGGDVAAHVDAQQLEQCVHVLGVQLALGQQTVHQHRALLEVGQREGVLGRGGGGHGMQEHRVEVRITDWAGVTAFKNTTWRCLHENNQLGWAAA